MTVREIFRRADNHISIISFAAVVCSRHTTPSFPRWREHHCVTRPNDGCERDSAYSRSSNRKGTTVTRLKNIISRNFTAKSRLKLSYLQYNLTKDTWRTCIREDTQSKRKWSYFKEGSLIGCYLSGLCPLCVRYVIKYRLFAGINTRLSEFQSS